MNKSYTHFWVVAVDTTDAPNEFLVVDVDSSIDNCVDVTCDQHCADSILVHPLPGDKNKFIKIDRRGMYTWFENQAMGELPRIFVAEICKKAMGLCAKYEIPGNQNRDPGREIDSDTMRAIEKLPTIEDFLAIINNHD